MSDGRRVAVIGVHGVGEQVAGATAAAIVELLGRTGAGRYSAFTETGLKIPVTADGLGIAPTTPAPDAPGIARMAAQVAPEGSKPERAGPFSAFGSVFYEATKEKNKDRASGGGPVKGFSGASEPTVELAFTQTLLKGGEGYRSVYESTCWSGKKGATPVDVYELYWSDLSHGGSSGNFAVFGQFIQLLVHLASLGRTTAAAAIPAVGTNPDVKLPRWEKFYFLNALSYWLLSMPIVIGNLWFILLGLDFTAAKLAAEATPEHLSVAQGVVCGLGAALAVGWLFFKILPFPLCALVTGALGVLGGWGAWFIGALSWDIPLGLLAAPLVWAIGEVLMRGYDNMRPGALVLWRRVGLSVLLVAGIFTDFAARDATYRALLVVPQTGVKPPNGELTLLEAAKWFHDYLATTWDGVLLSGIFHAGEVLFFCIALVWIGLCLCNLCLVLLGATLAHGELNRTVHTCVATALLPAPLFLGAALAAWGLFANDLSDSLSSVYIAPLKWPLHWPAPDKPLSWSGPLQHVAGATQLLSVHDLLVRYIEDSGWVVFLPYSVTVLLVLILILVGLAPSIYLEVFPLASTGAARHVRTSKSLGGWLDSGFNSIRGGSGMVLCAFLFVLGAGFGAGLGYVLNWAFGWSLPASPLTKFLPNLTDLAGVLEAVGLGAGTATAGFLAATKLFSGTLSDVFGKMRVAVDTLQDVDNWLRERPEGATVRLHVFARYRSLLRYLAEQNYTDVLIVAHSQGTVVTADLLRHLTIGNGRRSSAEAAWKVTLLTMGCPLRQLYNWRFPQLYEWAVPQGIPSGPNPEKLGLERWVNAYGSGDYVGRNLWGPEVPPTAPLFVSNALKTSEFCVGAQAHTFYLHPENATIGATIDRLI